MKRFNIRLAMLAIALVVVVAACTGSGNSPTAAVRAYLAAVEKGDAAAIGKVATPETAALTVMFGDMAKAMMAASGKITNTSEKIDGDTAVVTVTFANGETEDYSLIKDNGTWKVDSDK